MTKNKSTSPRAIVARINRLLRADGHVLRVHRPTKHARAPYYVESRVTYRLLHNVTDLAGYEAGILRTLRRLFEERQRAWRTRDLTYLLEERAS